MSLRLSGGKIDDLFTVDIYNTEQSNFQPDQTLQLFNSQKTEYKLYIEGNSTFYETKRPIINVEG